MSAGRGPWSRFRAALDEAGFRPARRLGQCFLLDDNMARAIVRDAGVGPGDRVLEVGAGCGFLSLHLAQAGVDLTAVEIDDRLAAIARELCAGAGSVRIVTADALAGKHDLGAQLVALLPQDGIWHVVANLPYSIAAPLLVLLAARDPAPATMTVLVQREVAERIAARPGGREWGPLSIRLQLDHAVDIRRRVAPDLFWPRPRVESALVRLERREAGLPTADRKALDELVGRLFQRRRQALGRVLGELLGAGDQARGRLEGLGIDPRRRAETLDLAELVGLVRAGPWKN